MRTPMRRFGKVEETERNQQVFLALGRGRVP